MTYKKSIIDIISEMNAKVVPVVEIVDYVFDNINTHTLILKDLFYLQKGFKIIIDGEEYNIESIDYDTDTITLLCPIEIEVTTFPIYLPKFFHGTIRQTNNELQEYVEAKEKTPMIYLYENLTERFFEDGDNSIERESDLRLFFLSQADFQTWQTNDFYENCLIPMRRFMEMFIEEIKKAKIINQIKQYDTTSYTHFGVFINDKGYEKNFWVDNLSGIEFRITLEVIKQENCGNEY